MSHTPPVPDASVAPFPAHPAPHATKPAPAPAAKPDTTGDDRKRLIAGAAVGIGSAAIVAALLYANRKPGRSSGAAPGDDRRADRMDHP